jgi:hypothetical protein
VVAIPGKVRDRGKLRTERFSESQRSIFLRFPIKYWILTGAGIVAAILPFIAEPGYEGMIIISVGYTILMVVVMVATITGPPSMDVVQVYENGVTVEAWTGARRFVPFGAFTGSVVRERKGRRKLIMTYFREQSILRDDVPGFEKMLDDMEAKVGDKDYLFEDRFMGREREGRLQQGLFAWLVLAIVVATGTAIVLFLEFPRILGPEPALGVIALFLMVGMLMFPLFARWLFRPGTVAKFRLNKRRWLVNSVLLCLFLYFGFAGALYVAFPEGGVPDYGALDMGDPGPSTIAPGEYVGYNIDTPGPVSVHSGESLRMVDSRVVFEPSKGIDSVLWVEEGGVLELINTTVTTTDFEKGFRIEIRGSAIISACLIQGTCANYEEWDREAYMDTSVFPFMVLSDDVLIKDTTVADSRGSGLLLYDSKATVENCTFLRTEESALCVNWGEPTIINCTFRACLRGMNIWNTLAVIEDCTFSGLDYGIRTSYGNATVRNCTFEDIDYTAISARGHNITESDNRFYNVGTEFSFSSGVELGFWGLVILSYMGPAMFLFFAYTEHKKELKKYPDSSDPELEDEFMDVI